MVGILVKGAAMGIFQLVGWVRPRVPGQPLVSRDTVINLVTGVGLMGLKYALIIHIAAVAQLGLVSMAWLSPGWAQLVVAFLALDFTRYWVHYADHRVPFLWSFHRTHHSSEVMDSTSGLRMHVVDFFQLSAIPIVLFGVVMDVSSFDPWVLPAALAIGDVMDAFEHANIQMDMTKPWNRAWNLLLNSPHFHSWHHTRDGALCDGNYSNTLIIWDRLFGTDVTQAEPPELYGLGGDQAIENSLLGLQLLRSREATPASPASQAAGQAGSR